MSPTPFLAVLSPALRVLALLSLVLGLAYPLLVTALAQSLFPHQANGSLVQANGRVIGSSLIGQSFTQPHWFWGRPVRHSGAAVSGHGLRGQQLGPQPSGTGSGRGSAHRRAAGGGASACRPGAAGSC